MSSPPPDGDGWGWVGSPPPPPGASAPPPTYVEDPREPPRVLVPSPWGLPPEPAAKDAGQKRHRGIWGTIVAGVVAFFKYGVLLLKLGAFKGTLITMAISVVVYSIFFGPVFALGFVLLLLIHEMGHYLMARHLGQSVSAPVFVPLLGALINMRRQPGSVREEATMALAGPVLGTAASWACVGLGLILHSQFWAALGYLGCVLNLFNLIPASPLDGGRVTAAISKWANLVGLGVLGLYGIWALSSGTAFAPVLLIILIFAVFGTISRFRQSRVQPDYLSVSVGTRSAFLGLYLLMVLVAGLGVVAGYPQMTYVHTIHFGF